MRPLPRPGLALREGWPIVRAPLAHVRHSALSGVVLSFGMIAPVTAPLKDARRPGQVRTPGVSGRRPSRA